MQLLPHNIQTSFLLHRYRQEDMEVCGIGASRETLSIVKVHPCSRFFKLRMFSIASLNYSSSVISYVTSVIFTLFLVPGMFLADIFISDKIHVTFLFLQPIQSFIIVFLPNLMLVLGHLV